MGKEENEMRPLKKAQQQNLIISKEYYTEHELMKMLENKEIWYLDDDINFRCDCDILNIRTQIFRINIEDLENAIKEIKVVLNEYGYYENVAVTKNGKVYHVEL